jgi:hypothetical protein
MVIFTESYLLTEYKIPGKVVQVATKSKTPRVEYGITKKKLLKKVVDK